MSATTNPCPETTATLSRYRVLAILLTGALLRALLIYFPRTFDDDSPVYLELGSNLLHHGVYGFTNGTEIVPSLIRLPGYPLFLALLGGHYTLVFCVQAALDLLGCWLLARTVQRYAGTRAALLALTLGSLCLFTAAYSATALTESLSVFSISVAIYAFGKLLSPRQATSPWRTVPLLSAAIAAAMLLRPDGVLLLFSTAPALLWYGAKGFGRGRALRLTLAACALALLPMAPWTLRNWTTFHVLQPLAPRHVGDPGERVNLGFYRWLRTWSTEFVNTGNVYWNANEEAIDLEDVPARACDSPAQCSETASLLEDYNQTHQISPELDHRFDLLATERIRSHPVRYYLWVPAARVADMWLRPRTEAFDMDVFWWRFASHPWMSTAAVGFGLINLLYVLAALVALARGRGIFPALLLGYLLLRCLLLGTMENPEPRYTLEGYPMLIVSAAGLAGRRKEARAETEASPAYDPLPLAPSVSL